MNRNIDRAKREEGFTLIELLVVVIIIGILAAIAIPVFLNQRDNARNSAVESTLRSAATYMEIVYTESGDDTYPLPTELADLTEAGFRSGDNVAFEIVAVNNDPELGDGQAYCLGASHGEGTGDDANVTGNTNFYIFESVSGVPEAVADGAAVDGCTVNVTS